MVDMGDYETQMDKSSNGLLYLLMERFPLSEVPDPHL